jgi:hypothetical protein
MAITYLANQPEVGQNATAGLPWEAEPDRLWSLLDMRQFLA